MVGYPINPERKYKEHKIRIIAEAILVNLVYSVNSPFFSKYTLPVRMIGNAAGANKIAIRINTIFFR